MREKETTRSVLVSDGAHRALKRLAVDRRTTLSALVRAAIERFLAAEVAK